MITRIIRKCVVFLFLLSCCICFGQDIYSELRDKYWQYDENDSKAFTYLNISIAAAKKEKNFSELYQIYEDAIRFSPDKKLQYADSAITAAKLSGKKDLIGSSHIVKGIVYYFTYRKFQPALDEYLKAYPFTKNSDDPFLKYENLYHIGVVKSYLGYYDQAIPIFEDCINYFEPMTRANIHGNLIINNKKGYLNSLHQLIICYQALGNFNEAKTLISQGILKTPDTPFFNLEKSYFNKSLGVSNFNQKKYYSSINNLDKALPELLKINDFTWASVAYYYKGQSYQNLGNEKEAIKNYKKVDSIFTKYHFILPEIRKNYEELIAFYRNSEDVKQELFYTNQLLKADEIIARDFKYLSSKIHKDYDTESLLEAKMQLEQANFWGKYLIAACMVIILVLAIVLALWIKRKKAVGHKYNLLLAKINSEKIISTKQDKYESSKTTKVEKTLTEKLLKNLGDFESSEAYLEKGLTLNKLADVFDTNTSYLSQVINEYKGSNFNTYINTLRIKFATQKIYSDKEWRKYSVEDIASLIGFSNRQSFSNVFFEQNGIRPADFIKKRKQELN